MGSWEKIILIGCGPGKSSNAEDAEDAEEEKDHKEDGRFREEALALGKDPPAKIRQVGYPGGSRRPQF